ncbi:MAG: hypothetical protein E6G56_04605 [Actinobacteria bacterium]|nr:MAG: hypothetical protein E6G56_04605 [Actinomycetota bacterium]
MPTAKPQRVSIGFHGGQVLSLRMGEKDVAALNKALGHQQGWHELVSEEGPVRVDLEQIVYLRVESEEHRVGFGA